MMYGDSDFFCNLWEWTKTGCLFVAILVIGLILLTAIYIYGGFPIDFSPIH